MYNKKNIQITAEQYIESLKNDILNYSSSTKEHKEAKKGSKREKFINVKITNIYDKNKLDELEGERDSIIYNLTNICTLSHYVEEVKNISRYAYYTNDRTFNLKNEFLKIVGLASLIEENIEHFTSLFHGKLDYYDKVIMENYGKEALAGMGAQIRDEEGE
jgi:hypothetical protein